MLADRGARTNQRSKIRAAHGVHRCGNRDYDDIGGGKLRRIRRYRELRRGTQILARDLAGRVDVATVVLHLLGAQVKSYGPERLAECHRQGQANVTESNNGNYAHRTMLIILSFIVLSF